MDLIAGASTTLEHPFSFTFAPNGDMVVGDSGTRSVLTFVAGSTGNVAPIYDIHGSNAGIDSGYYARVDSSGTIWVSDLGGNRLLQFAATDTGNVAPENRIVGASTQLDAPYPMAFAPNGQPVVSNSNSPGGIVAFDGPFAINSVSPGSGPAGGG